MKPKPQTKTPSTQPLVAIYTFSHLNLMLLIPKRRGTGYCKSVFGFHSSNKNCTLFDDLKPDWFCSDTCDIDSYLSIELFLNKWDDRFEEGLKLTFEALSKVFPFVTEFVEDDQKFWEVLLPEK